VAQPPDRAAHHHEKIFSLLLCLSLSIFTVARATKPAHTATPDAKTLLNDANKDEEMGPGDNDSMEGASDDKGEDMNDDDSSDAAGDEDTADDDGTDNDGAMMAANKNERQFSSRAGQLLAGILPARGQYSIANPIPFAARSSSG
jgi:hypothetical protein